MNLIAAGAIAWVPISTFSQKKITDVRQGTPKIYEQSVGDTWDPAWADDDHLYAASDDGSGWNGVANSNVSFSRISGKDVMQLSGVTVSAMTETGIWGAGNGPDNRTWKSSGCIALDGVLYLVIGRHMYGDASKDPFRRQTAINSSIIMSKDHGKTWTPDIDKCFNEPMFKGNRFATPYFIYYGKDGAAPAVDNADKYIYATSNNGFWNNGDRYFLGRVERYKMGNLNASDWEFYTGGDGMKKENWSPDAESAVSLIDNPLRCGMTGATYLPTIKKYVMIGWYYPRDMNVESNETRFIYYQSAHPWGPWTIVHEEINAPAGWYSPRVMSKWQKPTTDGVDAVIATAGDFWEIPWFYKFAVIPVKFKVNGKFSPKPSAPSTFFIKNSKIGKGINEFTYSGDWQYIVRDKDIGLGNYHSEIRGNSFSIRFRGNSIKWYSCKGNAVGIARISIDGKLKSELDLWTRWAPGTLHNRLAYDSGALPFGEHILTVEVTGDKNKESKGCGICNEKVEIGN